jgi:class 3 adenylate cyclase
LKPIIPRYQSLDDFLVSSPLSVDGVADDGWGAGFPIKGREIDAVVLFADISNFTGRTAELSSTETLVFVNHFIAWMLAEGLSRTAGIIDKYIGDEIMIVFSREFGSVDPVVDAVLAATRFGGNDFWGFSPHMGIASGIVTVGYTGTPIRHNCSVFGSAVALAARCASVKPEDHCESCIVLPALLADSLNMALIDPDSKWRLLNARKVPLKNLGQIEVRELVSVVMHFPSQSPAERAKETLKLLFEQGRYWPLSGKDSL